MEQKFGDLSRYYNQHADEEMIRISADFFNLMRQRRSIRAFSGKPVPREIIEHCIHAAATAPSGANCQPWHFVVIENPEMKKKIRASCEPIEKKFYDTKAPQEWLDALSPLGTNEQKPFLEKAPCLIVLFAKRYEVNNEGEKIKAYFIHESIGIATGILITALHSAGLGILTYTPRPMGFLNTLLNRPENERPFIILAVGHPAPDCTVPELERKSLEDVVTYR